MGTASFGTAGTITPTNPTHAIGDVLVCTIGSDADGSVTPTHSLGAPWRLIHTAENTTGTTRSKVSVYARVANSAAEPDPTITVTPTGAGACHHSAVVASYQDAAIDGDFWMGANTAQTAGASAQAITLTTTAANGLGIVAAMHGDNVATGVTTATQTYTQRLATDNATGIDGFLYIGDRAASNGSGNGTTVTFTGGGTGVGVSAVIFALKEKVAPTVAQQPGPDFDDVIPPFSAAARCVALATVAAASFVWVPPAAAAPDLSWKPEFPDFARGPQQPVATGQFTLDATRELPEPKGTIVGAVQHDSTDDRSHRSTNIIDGNGSWTVGFWWKPVANVNFDKVFELSHATNAVQFQYDNGSGQAYWSEGGSGLGADTSALTNGTWYFIAFSHSVGAGGDFFYWRPEGGAKTVSASSDVSSLTFTDMVLGPTNGSCTYNFTRLRIWSSALTEAQLDAEFASAEAVITSGLNTSLRMETAPTALVDTGSLADDWDNVGTPARTTQVGPTFGGGAPYYAETMSWFAQRPDFATSAQRAPHFINGTAPIDSSASPPGVPELSWLPSFPDFANSLTRAPHLDSECSWYILPHGLPGGGQWDPVRVPHPVYPDFARAELRRPHLDGWFTSGHVEREPQLDWLPSFPDFARGPTPNVATGQSAFVKLEREPALDWSPSFPDFATSAQRTPHLLDNRTTPLRAGPQGLRALWKLDGNGNDAIGSHHMSASGVTWGPGKIGGAATVFGGGASTLVASAPNSVDVTGDLTVGAWIYPTSSSDFYTILMHGEAGTPVNQNFNLIQVAGDLRLYGKNNGVFGAACIQLNQWQFVVATRRADGFTSIYWNGGFVASGAGPVPNSQPTKATRIGCREDNYSVFQGKIDTAFIYDRVLDATEVEAIYKNGVGLFDTSWEPSAPDFATAQLRTPHLLPTTFQTPQPPTAPVAPPLSWLPSFPDFARVDARRPHLEARALQRLEREPSLDWLPSFPDFARGPQQPVATGYYARPNFPPDAPPPAPLGSWYPAFPDFARVDVRRPHLIGGSFAPTQFRDIDLRGWWKLDTNSNDSSGLAHHGSDVGGVHHGTFGRVDGAAEFNGVDGRSTIVDHADLRPTKLTISAWVRTTARGYREVFHSFSQEGSSFWVAGFELRIEPGGRAQLVIGNRSNLVEGLGYCFATGTTPIDTGRWTHLVGTFDGTNARLYVNGALDGSATLNGIAYDATNRVRIGNNNYTTGQEVYFWRGGIDDIRLWAHASTADEVSAIFASAPAAYVEEARGIFPDFARGPTPLVPQGQSAFVKVEREPSLDWLPSFPDFARGRQPLVPQGLAALVRIEREPALDWLPSFPDFAHAAPRVVFQQALAYVRTPPAPIPDGALGWLPTYPDFAPGPLRAVSYDGGYRVVELFILNAQPDYIATPRLPSRVVIVREKRRIAIARKDKKP